ncbi:MAG: DUF2062 domain-containing protein [Candidatus Babeliales bacterium]
MASFTDTIKQWVHAEPSPYKVALSVCVGNYIAFSPFIGFHTILVFISAWLLRLNTMITLAMSYLVNNPWTAIPIYSADYFFGRWVMHSFLRTDMAFWTPAWLSNAELWCATNLGVTQPCFWPFFVGGNLLGIIISMLMYPIVWLSVRRLIHERNKQKGGI